MSASRSRQVLKPLALLLLFAVPPGQGWAHRDPPPTPDVPHMRRVEPPSVKAGGVATVFGDALDKTRVEEIYLTDAKQDVKLLILDQQLTFIKFQIPADAPKGRFCLMVLMKKDPKFIEQPVFMTVE